MVERRTPKAVEECVRQVMAYARHGAKEFVPIEAAYGRYLAEDLIADHDVPMFDRSPYDGFAVRSADTAAASSEHPVSLKVVGEIGAGSLYSEEIQAFEAVRIMTGAQIPQGCDAIVMLELTREYTDGSGQKFMEIKRPFSKGHNISFQGEEVRQGAVLVRRGTFINPGVVALLATFGYKEVPVARKPVIGVIATGSELLEVEDPLEPGKIRNSNAYMILAQIEKAGGEARYYGKLNDVFEECLEAVNRAFADVDMLITTGGVSVGDYDYLPAIYEAMGATVLFNKVAMRPGSVTTVASLDGKLLFGLSGNPSACYVGFELFVRPIVRTWLFSDRPHLRKERAWLAEDFPKPNPFTRFIRGRIWFEEGKLLTAPSGFDKSSAVSSLASANSLIVLPGGTRGYLKGMMVDVLLLDDVEGSDWPWDSAPPSYKS